MASGGGETDDNNTERKDSKSSELVNVPETNNKDDDINLLRSQIYFGDLGKLTPAEEAALKAKLRAQKTLEQTAKFIAKFAKKEDTRLPWSSAGLAHEQTGGNYSAKEVPPVPNCPNIGDHHVCTEYCIRNYGSKISKSSTCNIQ